MPSSGEDSGGDLARPALDELSEENRTLIEALRTEDPDLRQEALEIIVDSVDDQIALELIHRIEHDQDEDFRARAAIALGPAIENCGDELDPDGRLPDPEDPLNLADLSQPVYEQVQARLRRVYEDPEAPTMVRRRALETSVRARRPWHPLAIANAWASADQGWKQTALFCMGFAYPHDYSSEIEQGLLSDSTELVLEAVVAAGRREIHALAPRLSILACDRGSEQVLRLAAIEALTTLESSDQTLVALSEDLDPEIAAAAREASIDRDTYRRLDEIDDLSDVRDASALEGRVVLDD